MMPFIKWSGSKRSQAKAIICELEKVPCKTYYEPFLGSGAVLGAFKPANAICSDLYAPLTNLWNLIRDSPELVAKNYECQWNNLQNKGHLYFYEVRERLNKNSDPMDLLFISRTCVNGLIRFNSKGEFNNSLHHTRKGMAPNKLEQIIDEWHRAIKNYTFLNGDYRDMTSDAKKGDLVYLDPPYFNNKNRYLENIDHNKLFEYLEELNRKSVRFVLSYDGHSDSREYKHQLPKEVYKRKLSLSSGLSAFRKTQDKTNDAVYESVYTNF